MKVLFDFFPLLVFFCGYFAFDIYKATAAGIVASFLQVGLLLLRHGKVETVHVINLVAFTVFGGATLLFHTESFIKWKVTVVNALFAMILLGSQWFGRKNVLELLMGEQLTLPKHVWATMAYSWALFFLGVSVLNLWIAFRFDLDTWVLFKFAGILTLTLLMVIGQAFFLAPYIKQDTKPGQEGGES